MFLKNSWNCEVRQNFFTKTCLTNNYLSCGPHLVILGWVQCWNISEKLMKVCSPLEFCQKNILTNNYFSRDPHFVILAWVQSWKFLKNLWKCVVPLNFFTMRITQKVIVRETWFCEKNLADFTVSWVVQKYFNFVPMLAARNVDHVKSNCSWVMFLWKNSGGLL